MFVDNLFVASGSANGCALILKDAEQHFRNRWRLRFKPSSKSVVPAFGQDASLDRHEDEYPLCSTYTCLSNILQNNGGVRACWVNTRKCMWSAFWGNAGSADAKRHSKEARFGLLNKTVLRTFLYQATRWPPQKGIAEEVDRIQKRMYGIILNERMDVSETLEGLRRYKNAAKS